MSELKSECERVTACCGEDDRFVFEGECPCSKPGGIEGYKCKQHGEPWPDYDSPCVEAALEVPA